YETMLSRRYVIEPGRRRGRDRPEETAGAQLSGGQWQRVALARAVMRRDASLLVLDEPSAGLDAEAERDLADRIWALRSGRTTLVISHRLNTVRAADHIAVLDHGRVVEAGGHDELLALDGRYARLFRAQAEGYSLGGPGEP